MGVIGSLVWMKSQLVCSVSTGKVCHSTRVSSEWTGDWCRRWAELLPPFELQSFLKPWFHQQGIGHAQGYFIHTLTLGLTVSLRSQIPFQESLTRVNQPHGRNTSYYTLKSALLKEQHESSLSILSLGQTSSPPEPCGLCCRLHPLRLACSFLLILLSWCTNMVGSFPHPQPQEVFSILHFRWWTESVLSS